MKVLFLSTVYPNPNSPTSGIFVHEQISKLVNLGIEAVVISPIAMVPPVRLLKFQKHLIESWQGWIKSRKSIPAQTHFDDVTVFYPKWLLLPKLFFGHLEGKTLYVHLKSLLQNLWKTWRWDIIHAHFLTPGGMCAEFISKKYNTPFVVSCLGSDLNFYAQQPKMNIPAFGALNHAEAIICKSGQLGKTAVHLGARPDNVHIVHNGCDLSVFKPVRREVVRKEVLFIGHFTENKGLINLIEAFSGISDAQVKMRLIGSGDMLPAIKKSVAAHGISDRVFFHEPISHAQVPSYLNGAALLCLPSRNEGTPNVIMEALACGTPVVATAVGGISEIVPPFAGILVPPDRPLALREALENALSIGWDKDKIRRYAVENLSSETQCRKIIRIYTNVFDKSSSQWKHA